MTPGGRPPASLRARALALLARREHSRTELRLKLQRIADASASVPDGSPAAPEDIELLLDWLESQDLLSTRRFIESRLRTRAARFGNERIRQELGRHGLAPDAEQAQELKRSEQTRALEVWRSKYGVLAPDAAGRARQARFLSARGFSSDIIRAIVLGRLRDEVQAPEAG